MCNNSQPWSSSTAGKVSMADNPESRNVATHVKVVILYV